MRRIAMCAALLAVLAAVLVAAGCGPGEQATATPETIVGEVPKPGQTADIPALDLTGDAASGKTIFTANCGGCHTLSDAGTSGAVGPNLDSAKPSLELVATRVTLGQGAMPAFSKEKGGQLDDQQIADVAAYVTQATGG